ncbi:MAG: hypothetical protein P4L93_11715 [Coriobacteriia bacterium]|nr:hypothetical protein [Coriobacteriia bacterium]
MTAPVPDNFLHTAYYIFEVIGGFIAFAFIVTFGLLVKKYSVFKFQNDAIENLQKAFETEKLCREQLAEKVHEQEVIIAELRGVVRGKDHALEDAFRAAVNSGGCDDAFVCKMRKVPGEHILSASSTLSPNGE